MKKKALISLGLVMAAANLLSSFAMAEGISLQDAEAIKKITGKELAGAYQYDDSGKKIVLLTESDYLRYISSSVIREDLNMDGKDDLIVVSEDAPNSNSGGTRSLQIYLSSGKEGELKLFAEGKNFISKLGENGVIDSFVGIGINERHVISVAQEFTKGINKSLLHGFQLRRTQGEMRDVLLVEKTEGQISATGDGTNIISWFIGGIEITQTLKNYAVVSSAKKSISSSLPRLSEVTLTYP